MRLPGRLLGGTGRDVYRGHLLGDPVGVVDIALNGCAAGLCGGGVGLCLEPAQPPCTRLGELGETGLPLVRTADHAGIPGELVPARLAAQHASAVRETGQPGENRRAGEVLLPQPDQAEQPAGRHGVSERATAERHRGDPGRS